MKIHFFGVAKEIVGSSELDYSALEFPKTVAALKAQLLEQYPKLQELSSLAVALNKKYATEEMELSQNDEIAIIPPVSGG